MTTPNRVADAAELLQQFIEGMAIGAGDAANGRAAVVAIQLLAIASQLERIADAQEQQTDGVVALLGTIKAVTL